MRCDILYIYTERERKESRISIAGAARRHMKAADVLEDMPLSLYIYIYIYGYTYPAMCRQFHTTSPHIIKKTKRKFSRTAIKIREF